MQLIEREVQRPVSVTQQGLPEGVLCRAVWPICNCGKRNRNNRVYERQVWESVMADQDVKEKLDNRRLFGNCEHPADNQLKLDKDATSHIVIEIRFNQSNPEIVEMVVDVLGTDAGRFIHAILKAGCGLGTSTRADGDLQEKVDENGSYQWVIPDKYRFITLDCTADPSTFGAYPRDIQDSVARAVAEQRFKSADTQTAILESLTKSGVAQEALKTIREAQKPAGATAVPESRKPVEDYDSAGFRHEVQEATLRARYDKAVELLTESRKNFSMDIQGMTQRLQECQAGRQRLMASHRALQEQFDVVAKAAKRLDIANQKLVEAQRKPVVESRLREGMEGHEVDVFTKALDVLKKDRQAEKDATRQKSLDAVIASVQSEIDRHKNPAKPATPTAGHPQKPEPPKEAKADEEASRLNETQESKPGVAKTQESTKESTEALQAYLEGACKALGRPIASLSDPQRRLLEACKTTEEIDAQIDALRTAIAESIAMGHGAQEKPVVLQHEVRKPVSEKVQRFANNLGAAFESMPVQVKSRKSIDEKRLNSGVPVEGPHGEILS